MEMKKPIVLRKRFIPFEVVDISHDELLFRNESLLVTKWTAIKPRRESLMFRGFNKRSV